MKNVVLDPETWARGGVTFEPGAKGNSNNLLNPDGTMCCLGFAAKQLFGAPSEQLLECPLPSYNIQLQAGFESAGLTSGRVSILTEINDDDSTYPRTGVDGNVDVKKRVGALNEALASWGVDFRFVLSPPEAK